MTDQEAKERLEKRSTRELLSYLEQSRKFRGWYCPWYPSRDGYTSDQIKSVLATREHIPNKAERKKMRQAKKHQGSRRGLQRCRRSH